jgi:hypothetical protein
MALADLRLAVLTLVQRWDAATGTLRANVLLVPSVDPVGLPLFPATPAFADRLPDLTAVVIGSLDATPTTADTLAVRSAPKILDPLAPAVPAPAYNALVAQATAQGATIATNGPPGPASSSVIRKALPQSYLDATGARPGSIATSTDAFGCAIRGTPPDEPNVPIVRSVRWGELISYALRQPRLAAALGLRYELSIQLSDPTALRDGGWLFVELSDGDAWKAAATPGEIRLYASRIPPLAASRQVVAAVLFPVDAGGTSVDDIATVEAETYDDGFAKVVHLYQPAANDAVVGDRTGVPAGTDVGIQIGWDDEQVVTWQNRQIAMQQARAAGTLDAQAPLGVSGYRLDVADVTGLAGPPPPGAWRSLVTADKTLPAGFGTFHGELQVEPVAVRPRNGAGEAWLPRYFTMWHGGSLLTADPVPKALIEGKSLVPVADPVGVLISYGRSYAFRVRFADLSGGGPVRTDNVINAGPAATAAIDFKRHVPPKSPRIDPPVHRTDKTPPALTFFRPLIGYPEVLFTRLGATDADRGEIVTFFTSNTAPGTGKVVGLPDPDVEKLVILVEVRAPIHDVAGDGELDPPFRVLYRTERTFAALPAGATPSDAGLTLDVAYVDAPDITLWAVTQPGSGPLLVPRARDVRVTAYAVLRDDAVAIAPEATIGISAQTLLRAESREEPALAVAPVDGQPPLRALAFRRPPDIAAPPLAGQLAEALQLLADGLSLSAQPGKRVIFGASKAVRHSLAGDSTTLTFAAESELLRQWLVPLAFDLERDWTWDGLENDTFTIERNGTVVGTVRIPNTVGGAAIADPAHWDRSRTRVVFFDAVDPHETTPTGYPQALEHTWRLTATRVVESGPPVGVSGVPVLTAPPSAPGAERTGFEHKLVLPTTVPPAQVPELASVGLALSPFVPGSGYATTAPRRRALWLELKEPIAAPFGNEKGDALFARAIGHGADPLLYSATPDDSAALEPALVLDPELMREIVPGDSDDRAGIDAMQQLERAGDSNVHFLLPLPPGVDPDDPELFGFYTYELRVGHAGDPHDHRWWSTANGRFGRPLRISGVQHPAPALSCRAGRVRISSQAILKPTAVESIAELRSIPVTLREAVIARAAALESSPSSRGARSVALEVQRFTTFVRVTAPYATPVLNGRALVRPTETPRTTLCFFLYAQVVQADALSNRNVLLMHRYGDFQPREEGNDIAPNTQRDRTGTATFANAEIIDALEALGLPDDLPLSVLAAELLPGGTAGYQPNKPPVPVQLDGADPLGSGLTGTPQRILRVSPLVSVAPVC